MYLVQIFLNMCKMPETAHISGAVDGDDILDVDCLIRAGDARKKEEFYDKDRYFGIRKSGTRC